MTKPSIASDVYSPDDLFAGDNVEPVTRDETIVSGQNLTRGTVLGKITASGKLAIVDDAQADGTEAPYAVLAEDTDASGGDKVAPVYMAGEFNEAALTFGGDDTAADHRDALRDLGIHLKTITAG